MTGVTRKNCLGNSSQTLRREHSIRPSFNILWRFRLVLSMEILILLFHPPPTSGGGGSSPVNAGGERAIAGLPASRAAPPSGQSSVTPASPAVWILGREVEDDVLSMCEPEQGTEWSEYACTEGQGVLPGREAAPAPAPVETAGLLQRSRLERVVDGVLLRHRRDEDMS